MADESDTTDNCSASVAVAVEAPAPRPDLEVGTPTASDPSPETGAAFTLSATVRNAGDGSSTATTLRYYRSTDATISSSDTVVGIDPVGALAAAGTSAESIPLTAPSDAGTYYYGACVDAVADESDTTDNCSASVAVAVEAAAPRPDLEVGTPTASDPSPETGATFTLSATVRNAGDGASAATTLRYYRSADATITAADAEVGTDAVGPLAAAATSAESIPLTAPSAAGTYYYGACVDAVADESDTTDNCSGSVAVAVEAPAPRPDLEVGTPTASDPSPETGAAFTLSATVRNAGDGSSTATTLRYYRSTDATISSSDTVVGIDPVGALAAAGTSAESIPLTAPSDAGTYYYGACVDAVADESDTTDNCSGSVAVAVEAPAPRPDLEVGTPTASDPSPETNAGVHAVGDGAQRGRRCFGGDDAALLPVGRRDDHGRRRRGGNGRGGAAGGGGDERGVDPADGAVGRGDVLLRRVRGRGGGRVGHDRQLLGLGGGGRGGPGAAPGPGGGDADRERPESGDGRGVHAVGDGAQRGRRELDGDDAALLPLDRRDDFEFGHGGGD